MKHITVSNSQHWILAILLTALPGLALASGDSMQLQNFTNHWAGWLAIGIFVLAYALVIGEEALHLRKSKPTMVAAGFIWLIVALLYIQAGDTHTAEQAVRHNLEEFGELFLFLLAAMTYINTMEERGVFDALRAWLVGREFSLRKIFWITGGLAFVISPIADNLTTALLMATVVMAVGGSDHRFVAVACVNIVVAANAGGAFSPFGDITTLMVWQKGIVQFQEFFALFVPSVVNWLVPAVILGMTVPSTAPQARHEAVELKHGAWIVVGLFILTISMAVSAHNFLHLPPVLGMMTGLGFLKFYGYYLKKRSQPEPAETLSGDTLDLEGKPAADANFNIFKSLERAEWDTLMFFYGIILCVGGLGTIGYLAVGSQLMYGDLGATQANILVGVLSAIVDNIPVMFAVLAMEPSMDHGQWLLVTLTAGVGGSMLSIGSAAGVAVMGQARGIYTFFAHLKWSWAIALGYAASIWVHFLINAKLFTGH
ncbi:sodium/proton antiporter (NhaD family) [Thiogranum longum]|uniref:Sodium/proton antiporter (NhaD family) n=1 Tax=Thiogranum longum TaxID=1537524 RepID=A0A4V2PH27_9GAMM|nr:sodium:proton antiporter NhaD [Thiogranum longum]TCK19106.1 sodium/proton antiporter (NhaD family) [Thiogranum longum]